MNNVDSDHGDPVVVHLRCLCDISLLRNEEDDASAACSFRRYAATLLTGSPSVLRLVYIRYYINMHYGHIASDKGASICRRSLLSFVIRVLILHTKRTFHSAV